MTTPSEQRPVQFEWSNPVFEGKANPERVHRELEKLQRDDGVVKPDEVVEYARSHPRSELHKLFPWDDSEAARLHRLNVARTVIRSVRVIYSTTAPTPMRVYVRPTDAGGYKTLSRIASDSSPDEIGKLRKQALNDLRAWMGRYEQIVRSIPGAKTVIDQMVEMLNAASG